MRAQRSLFGPLIWSIALAGAGSLPLVPQDARAQAQSAELRVRIESTSGVPLGGALVALLDAGDQVLYEGLSSAAGTRVFRAPAGTYRVRVRRIGFEPFLSELIAMPRAELVLRVETKPVMLGDVVVSARSPCRRLGNDALTLASVWEEVSKALRSSQLTVEDLKGIGAAYVYRKEVGNDGAVLRNDTTFFVVSDLRPFGAVDPATLAVEGYVRGDNRQGWTYFGPDETVLLSEEFTATHCFRLARERARAGQIGLAFEPVPGRRVADIAGVFWLDEATSELREVTFRHVNAGLLSRFQSSGFARFRRMASGAWIVEEWLLQAPRLALRPGAREQIVAIGQVEDGGGISRAVVADTPRQRTILVFGVVFDSLTHRPLRAATVMLGGSVTIADDSGRFGFSSVPAGTAVVSFSHPAVTALGMLALQREVSLSGDSVELALATPSLRTAWLRICADNAPEFPAGQGVRGILHGTVRDESGEPVGDAQVTIRWIRPLSLAGAAASAQHQELKVSTDGTGRYAACGFRDGVRGTAFASAVIGRSPARAFSFAASPVVRIDLALDATTVAAQGPTSLIVTVVDSAGRPLADATVTIEGSAETARTDGMGRASVRAYARELTLGVRRIGFGERSWRITLGEGSRQEVRVALSSVQVLPEVRVAATPSLPAAIERRRTVGGGWFYGPEEISRAPNVQTLLARTPGASIEGTADWRLRFRHPNWGGDCWADVYVDGRLLAPHVKSFNEPLLNVRLKFEELAATPLEHVYAIEVYPRASQAPQSIVGLRDGCGVVLVWTQAWADAELRQEERRQLAAEQRRQRRQTAQAADTSGTEP